MGLSTLSSNCDPLVLVTASVRGEEVVYICILQSTSTLDLHCAQLQTWFVPILLKCEDVLVKLAHAVHAELEAKRLYIPPTLSGIDTKPSEVPLEQPPLSLAHFVAEAVQVSCCMLDSQGNERRASLTARLARNKSVAVVTFHSQSGSRRALDEPQSLIGQV